MKLTKEELEFLSAWAREEWEPECYRLPSHRLQLEHGVAAAHLIELIKAWATSVGAKDEAILRVAANREPPWPWSDQELKERLDELTGKRQVTLSR